MKLKPLYIAMAHALWAMYEYDVYTGVKGL
jgi:hypothetical protein